VYEGKEIKRALDIPEMLIDHRADVDGISDEFVDFSLSTFYFQGAGKDFG
jgi:hypothetical protein